MARESTHTVSDNKSFTDSAGVPTGAVGGLSSLALQVRSVASFMVGIQKVDHLQSQKFYELPEYCVDRMVSEILDYSACRIEYLSDHLIFDVT